MGVTFLSRCARCKKNAPELGDFGMMGLPSASTKRRSGEDAIQNFGYIHQGHAAIQLLTLEMDQYLSFLLKHRGHPIEHMGDADDEDERPTRIKPWTAAEEPEAPPVGAKHYQTASYGLVCDRCGESFVTESTDRLRRFEPTVLEPAQVKAYLQQSGDDDDVYRAGPLAPDDLDGINEFLQEHAKHRPRAVLVANARERAALTTAAEAGAMKGKSQARRFELVAGTSKKFWRIATAGTKMTVHFGRIGTAGQEKVKEFDDTSAAADEAETLIAEKLRKGYREVPDRD